MEERASAASKLSRDDANPLIDCLIVGKSISNCKAFSRSFSGTSRFFVPNCRSCSQQRNHSLQTYAQIPEELREKDLSMTYKPEDLRSVPLFAALDDDETAVDYVEEAG
jgi:hypothetical protein